MFRRKVNYDDFIEYKDEVEVELKQLRDEIKALKKKVGVGNTVKKLDWSSSKSPVNFFGNLLKYLYESDEVFYDNGNFFDGEGKFIAQRKGDTPLRVAKGFVSASYVENYPPAKRVRKGFYKHAADLGVLYHGRGKGGVHHTSLTSDEGEVVSGVVVHDNFLEKYKHGGLQNE